ncbi:uncharacterized protein LOC118198681 [Stegodyphus dumicola]|uniref:uncharacterized protein LOC118198681 n=1 Tax=Stegodyphus dumicola TaxID=202533 RepID=UPI0015AA265B|nr:uncharacterized protein LOC118198681 [Stegodyphus dumicola]
MTDNKRKASDTAMDSCKKLKEVETTKNTGVILEDEIPDGVFYLGDCVFVFPSTFNGHTSVHIRRYKKYGKKFYPTREGVTIRPSLIPIVIQRPEIPRSKTDLEFLPENEITIESSDFQKFTFTQIKKTHDGQCFSKSLIITGSQWKQMIKQYCAISTAVADEVYSSIDFFEVYKNIQDLPTDEDLPSSLDVSLGQHYLLDILEKSFRKLLTTMPDRFLKEPETCAEEVIGNRIETFNNIALFQNVQELVHIFYDNLWERTQFLALRPHDYLTHNFLKNVCMKDVLQKSRKYFCPENVSEYFEDLM